MLHLRSITAFIYYFIGVSLINSKVPLNAVGLKTAILGLMVLASCSNETNVIASNPIEPHGGGEGIGRITTYPFDTVNLISYTNFEFFGIIHNEGVEMVNDSLIQFLPNAVTNSVTFRANVANESQFYVNNLCSPTMGQSFSPVPVPSTSPMPQIDDFLDTLSGLTSSQKTILLRIDSILVNTPVNQYSYAVAGLATVQSQIDANSVDDNKPFLYAALAVACHSAQYWQGTNGSKWLTPINSYGNNYIPGYVPLATINWGEVAHQDYIGFISAVGTAIATGSWTAGAARGAIIGGLSTGGVGAIAGAIIGAVGQVGAIGVGGAVLASAAELSWQQFFS